MRATRPCLHPARLALLIAPTTTTPPWSLVDEVETAAVARPRQTRRRPGFWRPAPIIGTATTHRDQGLATHQRGGGCERKWFPSRLTTRVSTSNVRYMLHEAWNQRRALAADGLARRAPAARLCSAVHFRTAEGHAGLRATQTCPYPARQSPSVTCGPPRRPQRHERLLKVKTAALAGQLLIRPHPNHVPLWQPQPLVVRSAAVDWGTLRLSRIHASQAGGRERRWYPAHA